jgi:HEPN domain-containing protein
MSAATFISAAQKHLADTSLLLGQNRFDNAAYLSGYVVECSLKALLDIDGMPTEKELGHDLPLMASNALMLGYTLAPSRRRYTLKLTPDLDDLIHNWRPECRYEREGTTLQGDAESRLRAAGAAYEQIGLAMILDGQT